jgi:hypothetical protein
MAIPPWAICSRPPDADNPHTAAEASALEIEHHAMFEQYATTLYAAYAAQATGTIGGGRSRYLASFLKFWAVAKTKRGDYRMVLLQVEGAGPILGAAEFDHP